MNNFPVIDKILLGCFAIVIIGLGFILVFRQDVEVPNLFSTGIVLFSIQAIINYYLNKRIEKYKDEITNESRKNNHVLDLRLESFKSDLSLTYAKQSKLYENRLIVISDLYEKIVNLHQKMTELTVKMRIVSGDEKEVEEQELGRIKFAGDAYNDFLNFYIRNKIYLAENSCEMIESIQTHYSSVFHDYTICRRTGLPLSPELMKRISDTSDTVTNVITPILRQIESDFRTLLGVV